VKNVDNKAVVEVLLGKKALYLKKKSDGADDFKVPRTVTWGKFDTASACWEYVKGELGW